MALHSSSQSAICFGRLLKSHRAYTHTHSKGSCFEIMAMSTCKISYLCTLKCYIHMHECKKQKENWQGTKRNKHMRRFQSCQMHTKSHINRNSMSSFRDVCVHKIKCCLKNGRKCGKHTSSEEERDRE